MLVICVPTSMKTICYYYSYLLILKLIIMIGHLTDEVLKLKYKQAGILRRGYDFENNTVWIMYGKYTCNYYYQHEDNSWTNYDCKTCY